MRATHYPLAPLGNDEQTVDLGGVGGTGHRPVAEFGLVQRLRKGTFLGNVASAMYRSRKAPIRAFNSWLAARREIKDFRPGPATGRSRYRVVYLVPAGPGDWEGLRDALESIACYEGGAAKAIVIEDMTVDCRRAVIKDAFPDVDVLRPRWPGMGPPRTYSLIAPALEYAVQNYDFDVLGKIDTDALLTGSEPSVAALSAFRDDPGVGMIGTYLLRADGEPEIHDFDLWLLSHTERWSRSTKRLVSRARANGYRGSRVNGIYFLSPAMLLKARQSGDLSWRPPWWAQLGEDFWVSMLNLANGFRFDSFGGPGEQIVVAPNFLPMPKEEVVREGKLIVHSTRLGMNGESEEELRRFFRDQRTTYLSSEVRDSPAASRSNGPSGR